MARTLIRPRPSARPAARQRAAKCPAERTATGPRLLPESTRSRARGAGADAGARARADPLRADARLAVHVLPRRGRDLMAADLADGPRTGLQTQLCGDAHLSNFGGFAAPDRRLVVQHQRLRRDAAGPVRVGRQAARRELRRRRPRPRLRREGARARSTCDAWRVLPRGDARVRGDAQPRPLVRAPRHRRARRAESSQQRRARHVEATASANLAKARTKDSLKAFAKLTHVVDGEPRIVSDPPLIVPIDELVPTRARHEIAARRIAAADPRLPPHARGRPPPAARAVPLRRRCAQGRRRRQRRHARLDRA